MTIPEPKLIYRGPQPYVAIRSQVPMSELGRVLPPLHGELSQWLKKKGVKPSGTPFWRYLVVDMGEKLTVDVGFPVPLATEGDGRIIADLLPAGRYACAVCTGHPDGLRQATADLLAWAGRKGLSWRMNGEEWAGRIEWYLSDPAVVPDMNKWKTELAFLTTEK